jgi:multiple sugar transport system permease protein
MVDTTTDTAADAPAGTGATTPPRPKRRGRASSVLTVTALAAGALLFLFPFYYMLVGSLQASPDTSIKGAFPTSGFTLDNYKDINSRVDLIGSLVNSGIFTGGVLLGTIVFGVLAGYALARLHFRGRGTLFASMLLVQIVPFQLLLIPIYVLVVRTYGLADSYLGMILPFAINSTAVFVFRQFFLQLPDDLFAAAALDGASELRILWSVALPLVRPALLTVVLLTFIGPWNEFLWPFLVTKDTDMQPLAVTLANYISNVAARAANPYGAILAGAVVLAGPAVALFVAFQKHFTASDLSSGVKG